MAEIKKYLDNVALGALVDQIKAEDAKGLKSAKDYADSLAKNYDASGAAATAESNAKSYADTKVSELANGAVKANTDAIAVLNGEGEGSVKKAVADAKALVDADVEAVEAIANQNKTDIAAIKNAETGILAVAKKYTDDEVAKVQKEVDDLEVYVGTFTSENAKSVVEYIDEKTTGIASDAALTALGDRVTQAEKDIDAIEADYLKAADKTELEGKISEAQTAADNAQDYAEGVAEDLAEAVEELEGAIALKADQTALDAVSAVANAAVAKADYDVKVKALEDEDARIAGLVATETERATGVEAGLDARLVEVETFFKTAEGESLDEALDTLVEIQKYLDGEGAVADQMLLDIAANKKAIEDHAATDHDFAAADATLKSELEGKINVKADASVVEAIDGRVEVVEGKVETLESEMDDAEGRLDVVEAAVATKAEAQALADAVEALEGADAAQVERIEALEAKFGEGEGNVESQIATAKQEAIDAAAEDATTKANKALEDAKKYADDEDAKIESRVDALETASATHALAADLTALDGRVTTAEGEIDTLQTEMDAVEALAAANKAAHEANAAAIATKAAQADLEAAVARVAVNEGAIATINETLADKAEQDDLDAAVARIKANEDAIAENKSAIGAFTPITSDEVNALFA